MIQNKTSIKKIKFKKLNWSQLIWVIKWKADVWFAIIAQIMIPNPWNRAVDTNLAFPLHQHLQMWKDQL